MVKPGSSSGGGRGGGSSKGGGGRPRAGGGGGMTATQQDRIVDVIATHEKTTQGKFGIHLTLPEIFERSVQKQGVSIDQYKAGLLEMHRAGRIRLFPFTLSQSQFEASGFDKRFIINSNPNNPRFSERLFYAGRR